jgi:hypothetical protein
MLNKNQDGRKPYFYIIQHKEGWKYAGAKWGADADPSKFMHSQKDGYFTSSPNVKLYLETPDIIFSILEIIEEDELKIPFGCQTIGEYERWFLKENDCKNSDNWANKSNGSFEAMWTPELKEAATVTKRKRYGENLEILVENSRLRNLEKHGVEWTFNRKDVQEKCKESMILSTGYEYSLSSPEVHAKARDTIMRIHGVDNNSKTEISKENTKKTFLKTYGVDHPMKLDSYVQRSYAVKKGKYGFEQPFQNPEVRAKNKVIFQEKYGVDSPLQDPGVREKITQSIEEIYGVKNPSLVKFECSCGKVGFGLGNAKRWHKNCNEIKILKKDVWVNYAT